MTMKSIAARSGGFIEPARPRRLPRTFALRQGTMAKALGNILTQLLERYGLAQRAKEIAALDLWPEVVGEKIAKVTEAKDVREGRLFVKVENSVWRNELYYLKQEFITELNLRLGQNIVNDIVFV